MKSDPFEKRAFITGAGGFIASHLVEALLERGWQVTALVHYNSQGKWGHLEDSSARNHPRLTIHLGDVTDRSQMQALIQPDDTIFHLAALVGIPYSYHAPASYVHTNITGTLNILEAARFKKVRRVIVTSTSEVYGTARYTPIDEDHPLQAQSPYAATKIAADKLAEAYQRSFDLPVVVLRPFNTYGPRQSARAFIPAILIQGLTGADPIVVGNLDPQRDLTYVSDTVQAFVLAAETETPVTGQVIHFGQGTAVSMGDLAQACLRIVNSQARLVVTSERQRPGNSEVQLLVCNPAKAERLLGWHPHVSLEEGLIQTVQYLSDHLSNYKTERYNL